MKTQKTDDAKALLKLKKWLKKQGHKTAEYILSLGLPDESYVTPDLKLAIAREMISCIENYRLVDFWQGNDGNYFVEYDEGLDDFGRALAEDDNYPAPVKVRHPDGETAMDSLDGMEDDTVDYLEYLFGQDILLIDNGILASNTRVAHKRSEMGTHYTPNFPVWLARVAEAKRELDGYYRDEAQPLLAEVDSLHRSPTTPPSPPTTR